MTPLRLLFFGSFRQYSVTILDKLTHVCSVTAVVTTPPKPKGRGFTLTPTEVSLFAKKNKLPVLELSELRSVPDELERPDFLVVAGYGKLIPANWLTFPKIMAVNMHPSLLPAFRGAFPAEWAIIRGEKETGVTLVSMSARFDQGGILAQRTVPILQDDTRETLYQKLYRLGGDLLVESLPRIAEGVIKQKPQPNGNFFYARRLTREDGFEPWEVIQKAFVDPEEAKRIDRKFRAFFPWPGVWTEIEISDKKKEIRKTSKRLKILSLHLSPITYCLSLDVVQLEGKKPVPWKIFSSLTVTAFCLH